MKNLIDFFAPTLRKKVLYQLSARQALSKSLAANSDAKLQSLAINNAFARIQIASNQGLTSVVHRMTEQDSTFKLQIHKELCEMGFKIEILDSKMILINWNDSNRTLGVA